MCPDLADSAQSTLPCTNIMVAFAPVGVSLQGLIKRKQHPQRVGISTIILDQSA
jgi:hypothetical protein